jgi:hypothetical protein
MLQVGATEIKAGRQSGRQVGGWVESIHYEAEVETFVRNNKQHKDKPKPCSPLIVHRLFGGMCRLHRQGRKLLCLLPALYWALAWLILEP